MAKTKAKTTAQLKKELDKIFSQYIRQRYADSNGMLNCYTCGKRLHWKESQNSHFVSRQHLATRFDERNCRPACVGCNVFGGGQIAAYAEKLEQEYGVGIISELYREARKIVKDYPYAEKIEHYKRLIK
jgi:hypothetical protein